MRKPGYRERLNNLISIVSDVAMGDLSQQLDIDGEDEFAALGMAINEMIEGLREKEFIRNSFGKYVSHQVIDALLNGQIKVGGERREITVLFADIRGFTALVEKEEPEEVVKFLNTYFTRMINAILKHEGTVDKFIGDGLLAIFGAPLVQEDHAQRAIDAALAMRDELAALNRERIRDGKVAIRTGISINTGDAIVGNIGSEQKMEYTVVGNTVNVASRLDELNKKFNTDILISKSVYSSAAKDLSVVEMAPTVMRGMSEPIQCYQLLGIHPAQE